MSNWIEVNGARVEKEFFDANVREANSCGWSKIHAADRAGHVHCMICGITIDPASPAPAHAYKSKGGHVCAYCHDHFLK